MKGPKTKPDKDKILRGTFRKSRAIDSPEPSPDAPECPDDLGERSRYWFGVISGRIEAEGRLSASHTEVIAEAADRRAQVERCRRELGEDGWWYDAQKRDGATMKRPHPRVAQLNEAQRHLHSLLAELGLTPASLHKVGGVGSGKKKNSFEALG